VREPHRRRRLLASLAENGQQTPIIVVAIAGEPDGYLVIDGHQRIAALEQLGRDTVEATVWPMGEADALLLERTLRMGEPETALEQGWMLAELEERFGYSLDELARRFDRSVSWVSRRLALIELLPEAVQQQVREGKIAAHIAMKVLVPVARMNLDACRQMAEAFARHKFTTREAVALYAAWRDASASIRARILQQPELFLKVRQHVQPAVDNHDAAQLMRDLDMVTAIVNRALRRMAREEPVMDRAQADEAHRRIDRTRMQLEQLSMRLPRTQEQADVKPEPTHNDSGVARAASEPARDRARDGDQPAFSAPRARVAITGRAGDRTGGESRAVPPPDSGTGGGVQGESGAGP